MTKDFRNIGLTSANRSASGDTQSPAAIPQTLPRHQHLILHIIFFAALGFLVAGLWLLTGGRSPLPEQTSFFLGLALVISAFADFAVIVILKRIWSKPR